MCSWIILTFKINQTNKSIALLEGFDSEIVPMSDLTDLETLYRVTNLLLLSSFAPVIFPKRVNVSNVCDKNLWSERMKQQINQQARWPPEAKHNTLVRTPWTPGCVRTKAKTRSYKRETVGTQEPPLLYRQEVSWHQLQTHRG